MIKYPPQSNISTNYSKFLRMVSPNCEPVSQNDYEPWLWVSPSTHKTNEKLKQNQAPLYKPNNGGSYRWSHP